MIEKFINKYIYIYIINNNIINFIFLKNILVKSISLQEAVGILNKDETLNFFTKIIFNHNIPIETFEINGDMLTDENF